MYVNTVQTRNMWEDTTVVVQIILQSYSEEFQKKSFKIPFKCLIF